MMRPARVLLLLSLSLPPLPAGEPPAGEGRGPVSEPALPKRIGRVGDAFAASGANTTSLTVTVPAAGVPTGRRLIARLTSGAPAGAVAASDSRGNTWTVDADQADPQRNIRVVVLSAPIKTALTAGNTITVSFPGVVNVALVVEEFSGVESGTSAVVQKVFRSGTSGLASSGTLTTALSNALMVGLIATRGAATVTFQAGTGWTAEPQKQAGPRLLLPEYRVALSGGTLEASGSLGSSTEWAAVMVEYRAANVQHIPLPSEPPVTRAEPTTPTRTDLTLNIARQVLDGPSTWVTELPLGAPQAVTFRWGRPAVRAVSYQRLPPPAQAQWQMVASATPTSTVVFLPSTEVVRAGVPKYALYSYGAVTVAPGGSTADFVIPAAKLPTLPAPATISVRVVLSTAGTLHASPWVKIVMVKNDAPVAFEDPPPFPTPPVWIRLTEIEVVKESPDDSPEDEIYMVVVGADLKNGRVRTRITPVYDFDEQDASMRVRAPSMTVWGPDPTSAPYPIVEPDAVLVFGQLLERDEDESPSTQEGAIQQVLAGKLTQMIRDRLPRKEMAKQLRVALHDQVMARFVKQAGDELIGAIVATYPVWEFSLAELTDVVAGKVVKREFVYKGSFGEGFPSFSTFYDQHTQYKARFEIGKQGVKWE